MEIIIIDLIGITAAFISDFFLKFDLLIKHFLGNCHRYIYTFLT